MKLSDHEARALEGLERALRTEEPRLHARLRDMRSGGLTAWQAVLGLVSGIGLGLGLATAGTVAALPVLLWIDAGLTVPAPDRTCPGYERPVPA